MVKVFKAANQMEDSSWKKAVFVKKKQLIFY